MREEQVYIQFVLNNKEYSFKIYAPKEGFNKFYAGYKGLADILSEEILNAMRNDLTSNHNNGMSVTNDYYERQIQAEEDKRRCEALKLQIRNSIAPR